GLSAASSVRLDLRAGAFDRSQPDTNASTAMREFDVPPGTAVTRFSVSAHGPRDDVDLYVYRSNTLVDAETSHAGDELVTLTTPKPGRYRVYVNCHKRSSGGAGSFELTGWVVPRGNAGNLDVTPQPVKVTGGQPLRLRVSWAGLDTSKRWFGYVAYRHSSLRTYVTLN
ncbi:MAG: PPC domain-containing protein, partial [Nocardioidaceae bacterium]